MKKKELADLRKKTEAELIKQVVELKKKAAHLEVNMYAGRESNLKARKHLKREIAQILGIITELKSVRVKEQKKNK